MLDRFFGVKVDYEEPRDNGFLQDTQTAIFNTCDGVDADLSFDLR
jgi:hypothetical protein